MYAYLEAARLLEQLDVRVAPAVPERRYARPRRRGLVTALGHALSRIGAAFARARLRRQTIRALSALDDRTLEDIGIHRGQITEVAEAAVNGRDPRRRRVTVRPRQVRTGAAPAPRTANDNATDVAA